MFKFTWINTNKDGEMTLSTNYKQLGRNIDMSKIDFEVELSIKDGKVIGSKNWYELQSAFHANHNGSDHLDAREIIFKEWAGQGNKILDCGVHTGLGTNVYAEKNDVRGIDLPEVIKAHKAKYNFKCLPCNVDLEELPFEKNSFDIVIAGEFIEHLLQPESFILKAWQVLKLDGLLIGSVPKYVQGQICDEANRWSNKVNLPDPTHRTQGYTIEEFREMLKGKFEVINLVVHEENPVNHALIFKCRKI